MKKDFITETRTNDRSETVRSKSGKYFACLGLSVLVALAVLKLPTHSVATLIAVGDPIKGDAWSQAILVSDIGASDLVEAPAMAADTNSGAAASVSVSYTVGEKSLGGYARTPAAVVPEPATALLLFAGLAGFAAYRRFRK